MYYLPEKASRVPPAGGAAAHANNRAEIIRALSHGQVTRRDLFKWGVFTVTGALGP